MVRVARTLAVWAALCGLPTAAAAAPFSLLVQPIQVCNDLGTVCANSAQNLYEPEGDKIWAQAGIDLVFLPWVQFLETDYLSVSAANGQQELIDMWSEGAVIGAVNMWFVQSLFPDLGGTTYGVATLGSFSGTGYAAISDAVFTFNGGNGRRDTIAHELGHVLGLPHYNNEDPFISLLHNLMTGGASRGIPNGVGNITPDGAGYDQLSAAQIATVLQSDMLVDEAPEPVPEPTSFLLIGSGLLLVRRRLRAGKAVRAPSLPQQS